MLVFLTNYCCLQIVFFPLKLLLPLTGQELVQVNLSLFQLSLLTLKINQLSMQRPNQRHHKMPKRKQIFLCSHLIVLQWAPEERKWLQQALQWVQEAKEGLVCDEFLAYVLLLWCMCEQPYLYSVYAAIWMFVWTEMHVWTLSIWDPNIFVMMYLSTYACVI